MESEEVKKAVKNYIAAGGTVPDLLEYVRDAVNELPVQVMQFGLSKPTITALEKGGVKTLGDVHHFTRNQLRCMEGIGEVRLNKLFKVFKQFDTTEF